MTQAMAQLLEQALKLPPHERAALAEEIMLSVEPASSSSAHGSGAIAEARRRAEAIDRGESVTIPSEEVFRRLRERFGR